MDGEVTAVWTLTGLLGTWRGYSYSGVGPWPSPKPCEFLANTCTQ